MKKKLLSVLFLMALLFVCACTRKENKEATPTPAPTATATPSPTLSPTPTPTPVPENLALAKLNSFSGIFDFFTAYQPEYAIDYSKGVGYDLTANLSANQMLLQQLGLGEIPSFNLKGSFDLKDYLAGQCILSLDNTELATLQFFTDYTTFLFNLPKYSSVYASCNLQELSNSVPEGDMDWNEPGGDSTAGIFNSTNLVRTNTTLDSANISTSANLTELLDIYFKRFIECFKAEDGIATGLTIGTGTYTLTGEKHTVSAQAADLKKVIDTMAADPQTPANLKETLKELTFDETNCSYLSYYTDGADSYAWEMTSSNTPDEAAVFISTPAGFCLYTKAPGGSDQVAFSSVSTSKGAGTITIPSSDPETGDSTIEYLIGEKNISLNANLMQTIQAVLDYSVVNDVVKSDMSMTISGISVSVQQTATAKHIDYIVKLGLYGMELVTLNMTTDLREYCEIPLPKNSVDLDTWSAQMDMEALAADVLTALEPYPLLRDLILGLGTEEDLEDTLPSSEEDSNTGEVLLPDSSYTDAFMHMTGYSIDAEGFVDFLPLESEVFAMNESSTGFYLLPLPDATKIGLLNYAANLYTDPYEDLYSYYSITGSTLDNSVMSYYFRCYDYYNNTNWDNSISIAFDAISDEFIWVYCYHDSAEGAVEMANEVLELLGTDCILTTDIIDSAELYDVYLIQGESGEEYYTISIHAYLPE